MAILRRTNCKNKNEIIKNFLPFDKPSSIEGMLIGNDLDSLLSAALLKDLFGWNIVGIYDYENFWYDPQDNFFANLFASKYIAVDLDIYHQDIFSIGHHILNISEADILPEHSKTLNLNLLRGIELTNFRKKYPLGTIHFLLWLFDRTKLNHLSNLLVWLADSSFINGQSHRFRANVREWIQKYFEDIFLNKYWERIEKEKYEKDLMDFILPVMQKIGICSNRGQVESLHKKLKGFQCQWSDPNQSNQAIRTLLRYICSVTGWKMPIFPTSFLKFKGKRSKIELQYLKNSHLKLDTFLKDEQVFSYVFPYQTAINYTVFDFSKSAL
jgi:hypothetical protein